MLTTKANEITSNFYVFPLVRSSNVVNQPNFSFKKDNLEGSSYIFHVKKVTLILTSAVQSNLAAPAELADKFWDKFLGILMWTIHVVSSRDDDRHAEGALIRLGKKLGSSLRSCVRVSRFQY